MDAELYKMHGLGNEYVFIDVARFPVEDPASLSVRVSNRVSGIGSDGLVLIGRSASADFSMRIFNADGSEAEMCGNAARCIGRYVHDLGLTEKTDLTLETAAGLKRLLLHLSPDGAFESCSVDMGPFVSEPLSVMVGNRRFDGVRVNVGNPHFVVFTDASVEEFGPSLEVHSEFPQRTNVEFARFLDDSHIRMRVWERGSGLTKACGTGACATFAAALSSGLELRSATISMDGGDLEIALSDDGARLIMTGPAEFCTLSVFYL